MNKKYFIILLVFFFFMHIKKTHGCHPVGNGCNDRSNYRCGARVVYANLIPGKRINITVESPDNHDNNGVGGLGHFTMHIDNTNGHGGSASFFDKPFLVNGCDCDCRNIPRQYNWQSDFDVETPPKGTWFDVWISIYWGCFRDGGKKMNCHSEDVHYRTYVQ
ncbi:hypothetical protein F8M41_026579 [Gigaspora margarita]|uniref:Uncharacterized protein n=1 Tax=Gigaspora margarita TaxID=4874 RepID=A0A8H3XI79_GIGMA|nr:hypothetical protein F8M41_026579 [Gigaspora margarita]